MNLQTICRICITLKSEMISIFEPYNFPTHNCEIFRVITDCASVQIHEFDGFSKQICRKCLDHLSQAYSFKKLCEESDYKFRNNLFVDYTTAIKSEFSGENSTAACNKIDSELYADENSKITNVEVTEIKTEQCEYEIKTEIMFVNVEEEGSSRLSGDYFESMEYKEPSSLTNTQSTSEPVFTEDITHPSIPRRTKGRCKDCGNKKDRKTTNSCRLCDKLICREHGMPTCGECFGELNIRTANLRKRIKLTLPETTKQAFSKRAKGRCKDCGNKKDRKGATSCKCCYKIICREHTNSICCGCYEAHFNQNGD